MRTIRGYEAIETATKYEVLLYDTETHQQVFIDEAREWAQSGRDPRTLILENWPDSDQEAEQAVLNAFYMSLVDRHCAEASISELADDSAGLSIHPDAAYLAAKRLVRQGKLMEIGEQDHESVYRVPRTIYLKEHLLERLGELVCSECANLDLDGPFHEPCFMVMLDFLKNAGLTLDDIIQERDSETLDDDKGLPKLPKLDIQWLSRTAQRATSKWRSVVRPLLRQMDREASDAADPVSDAIPVHTEDAASAVVAQSDMSATAVESESGREQLTKQQLIKYLERVEILDDSGELGRLKAERMRLLNQLEAKDREILEMERKRAFLEKQCQEMQHDMDTLIQAMQIAKRRGPTGAPVIDATYHSES